MLDLFTIGDSVILESILLDMGQSRLLFRPFLISIPISIIQIEKSLGGVLGIRTLSCRMVGADETTAMVAAQKASLCYPQS